MNAERTVRAYYQALRDGEPLYPFFADEESTVKFGIGERLTGYEAIRDGLREQTETTDSWTVQSDRLVVTERDEHAWFSDDVFMAWTDTERSIRYEFDTRWSGTLEHRDAASTAGQTPGGEPVLETDWRFVGMHVSSEVPRTSDTSSSAERSRSRDGDAVSRDDENRLRRFSNHSADLSSGRSPREDGEASDPRDAEGDTR